ncbi:MAG: 1-hydroxycarotenoid 3,4-desaturase CrtD [Pseudomonadota bacterium]
MSRARRRDAPRVVVVGAGVGGLTAAADLARRGADVTVCERAAAPGGKLRQLLVEDGLGVDAGPTVFTMRWIFDGLYADAGRRLEDHLELETADVLARHAWRAGGRLDLHADVERSREAIAAFAGPADARGFAGFCARSRDVYATLKDTFIAAERPSPLGLTRRVGLARLDALLRLKPWQTLWTALGEHFADPRLRQLFGRYSTYVGSSPLQTPATLMLVAHVEQDGVWLVRGGMAAVARALQRLGELQGARYRYGAHVAEICVEHGRAAGVRLADGERLPADAVLYNGDCAALAQGRLGAAVAHAVPDVPRAKRSLSAVTWCLRARTRGFPLEHHNVFFAEDYPAEFRAIFGRREIVAAPTVYVCAQDRGPGRAPAHGDRERLLVLVNAPADGDRGDLGAGALAGLQDRTFALLAACGLHVELDAAHCVATTPAGFDALFPGTGGALYGRASHGPMASFARPGARSRVPGLYLAGGSVHPGPGVPMAAMSGRLGSARLLEDLAPAAVRAGQQPVVDDLR